MMTILWNHDIWNHDIWNPEFWKRCACGILVGPFKKLAIAQAMYRCDKCMKVNHDKLVKGN